MRLLIISPAQVSGMLLGLGALAYLLIALWSTWRFRERANPAPGWYPPISVLKPVFGNAPRLYECLRSFCEQDWPDYEIVFGAHAEDDPAVDIVRRLIRELPDRDIRLVIDADLAGPNRKAANLTNIYKAAHHDIIVLSDSDVWVDSHCLAAMAAPFVDDAIGAVACVYKARPVAGFASKFAALYVNDWFIPSVLVDVDLRGIDFLFGAMCAVRRQALDAIGGFARLSQYLADDFVLGQLVARAGWKIVLSPYACDTMMDDRDISEMLIHEIRWQRTVRTCRRLDHALSVMTFPLPLLLALLLPHPTEIGLSLIGLEIGLRILLHHRLRRSFTISAPARPWLVPLRDCVCFLAWAVALFGSSVRWRDQTFVIASDGRVVTAPESAR